MYKAESTASSDTVSIYTDEALEEAYSKGDAGHEDLNDQAGSDIYSEHIYEEIPECRPRVRPLPPIPEGTLTEISTSSKSIFTGATKYEILHYLQDARQRIEGQIGEYDEEVGEEGSGLGGIQRNTKHRVSHS